MKLSLLPDLTFPVTFRQADRLMDNVVKMNLIEAGLNARQQKALDILFDTYELLAKSKGKIDYTGLKGHARLYDDAMSFVGEGNPIVTRHGDLSAAHLSIAYNNAQLKLAAAGLPALSDDIQVLLQLCADLAVSPLKTEERMGLFLSYLQKRSSVTK